ncbi:MAG TPA: DMT family transporter [Frankiaceae bacterium]|jgi:drug/metabolite transporter (DMT)-like permease|nr:DMT family transporter [Frankiaceae bacterium]
MAALLALLASATWGAADFLGGALSRRVATVRVLLWSQACGLAFALCVVAFGGWRTPGAWLWWAVATGAFSSIGTACFYRALALGTMSVVAPISGTSLVVPVVWGLAAGERPGAVQLAGIGLAALGVVLASGPELRGVDVQRKAVLLAVAAAFGFGGTLVLVPRAGPDRWAMVTATTALTMVAMVSAYAVARPPPGPPLRGRDAAGVVAIGALMVAAFGLYAYVATRGLVAVLAVLASLYPVVTVVLAQVVFHERLRGIQLGGVLAAFAGVLCLAAG